MFAYVVAVAVLLRFGIPFLTKEIAKNPELGIDLATFYPLLVGYIAFFTGAMIGGLIVGFLLLDERDQNTLTATLVTPIKINSYLAYRVVVPMLVAFGVVVLEVLITNIAVVPLWQLLLIAGGASFTGALVALILANFAQNKVQGFAMLKIIGSSGLLLFGAWFVDAPFEYVFGLYPPYWAVKAYWMASANEPLWWLALAVGLVVSAGAMWFLMNRFKGVMQQES